MSSNDGGFEKMKIPDYQVWWEEREIEADNVFKWDMEGYCCNDKGMIAQQ